MASVTRSSCICQTIVLHLPHNLRADVTIARHLSRCRAETVMPIKDNGRTVTRNGNPALESGKTGWRNQAGRMKLMTSCST